MLQPGLVVQNHDGELFLLLRIRQEEERGEWGFRGENWSMLKLSEGQLVNEMASLLLLPKFYRPL